MAGKQPKGEIFGGEKQKGPSSCVVFFIFFSSSSFVPQNKKNDEKTKKNNFEVWAAFFSFSFSEVFTTSALSP